jgi:nicotinate phosphoribosyltransferase
MRLRKDIRPIDFVEELRYSTAMFTPPVQTLMDIDFYKLPMNQLIHRHYPDVEVVFELIVRDPTVPVATTVDEIELRKCLDFVQDLRFSKTNVQFIRGTDIYGERNMFSQDFLDHLSGLRLPNYKLEKRDGAYLLQFRGKWCDVSPWETIALAVISELYYRSVLKHLPDHALRNIYNKAQVRVQSKLEKLAGQPRIKIADFGQRRRHSYKWQEWVINLCRDVLGPQFVGTSNVSLANDYSMEMIGTNAHELPMVVAALAEHDDDVRDAQYKVPELWQKMYKALLVFLPDTFGSKQFFDSAPKFLESWRGQRQDSGEADLECRRYMTWLLERGIDPKERLTIFSDGLDADPILKLDHEFGNKHQLSYGWGTFLTNDFAGLYPALPALKPFSMVCKVVEANGRPCVKLSNNIAKATGPRSEIERYQRIFGQAGRSEQKVAV